MVLRISFGPQLTARALVVSKAGDVLTIDGEEYVFSGLPDGATIPNSLPRPGTSDPDTTIPCNAILGPVHRVAGELRLTLILPYRGGGRHVAAPPDLVDPPDGPIALPNLDEEVADVDA